MKKQGNRTWVVEEVFPFPEWACGADVSPTSLGNLCHCLFLTSPTTSHPLIPCLSIFFFFHLCFTSTHQPSSSSHYLQLFVFPPSFLGYLLTTSLCHIYLCWSNVAGEVCLSRRWQETGDSGACLVLCLLALSEQEKLHWGFWHLEGVERVTGLHEGDVSGKTKARRESETVAVALSFLDTNRGLLGSGTT